MYRFAYKHSDEVVFYFDFAQNKYVASGGNLAWRINNPGLVRSHSHFSRSYGSIGSCSSYAIFADPEHGRKALSAWLHSKKYYHSTLRSIAEHYQPNAVDTFVTHLSYLAKIDHNRKIQSLSKQEFDILIRVLEKLCGYALIGNESFVLLPKITGKIENGKDKEDAYLIGGSIILTKKETAKWIESHRLDGVIVHERRGSMHIRSRPNHTIWNIKIHESAIAPSDGRIDTLVRVVGQPKPNQCIWAFINGIDNSKQEALESAEWISRVTGGERVFSLPNDTKGKLIDFFICCVLKASIDTPIIGWTVKFLQYLLSLEKEEPGDLPIIVFVHSQGAIIMEHALELLQSSERERIRVFTFGGGAFIARGKSHVDSHNYASVADFVCRFSTPSLQLLALERYYGHKNGLTDQQIITQLAFRDATLALDTTNPTVVEEFAMERSKLYKEEFLKISNLTILDPDSKSNWKHAFSSNCYQQTVRAIIEKYQRR